MTNNQRIYLGYFGYLDFSQRKVVYHMANNQTIYLVLGEREVGGVTYFFVFAFVLFCFVLFCYFLEVPNKIA